MDGATLQAKIYAGYAQAAKRIGLPYDLHRPTDPLNPLANKIATLPAAFGAEEFGFTKPNKYGKPVWWALVDGSQTQVGDYLISSSKTFFIASQQANLPIQVVECNRTISVGRVDAATAVGALSYNADTPATEDDYMAGWPCSILQGPKGEKNEVGLPGDVRQPWWQGLIPAFADLTIEPSDIVTDDMGRRYITSVCELTDLGWRLTLQQANT